MEEEEEDELGSLNLYPSIYLAPSILILILSKDGAKQRPEIRLSEN